MKITKVVMEEYRWPRPRPITNGRRDSTDPLWASLYQDTLRLNADGTVTAPEGPGIGVNVNQAVLDAYRIA